MIGGLPQDPVLRSQAPGMDVMAPVDAGHFRVLVQGARCTPAPVLAAAPSRRPGCAGPGRGSTCASIPGMPLALGDDWTPSARSWSANRSSSLVTGPPDRVERHGLPALAAARIRSRHARSPALAVGLGGAPSITSTVPSRGTWTGRRGLTLPQGDNDGRDRRVANGSAHPCVRLGVASISASTGGPRNIGIGARGPGRDHLGGSQCLLSRCRNGPAGIEAPWSPGVTVWHWPAVVLLRGILALVHRGTAGPGSG